MISISMICALLFIAGDLILCAYSVHVLARSVNEKAEKSIISQAFMGIFISCVPVIIFPFIVSSLLKEDSSIFMIVLVATSSFFVGISWAKRWWSFIEGIEKELENDTTVENEVIEFPYVQLRDDIYHLCNQAGLANVELFLSNEKSINACARANYIKPSSITLTEGCLRLTWPEIAAIVGHELIHIKYKDNTFMAVIWRIVGGIFLIFLLIAYILFIEIINNYLPAVADVVVVLTLPIVLFYLISMFIFLTIDNRRYWYQIQELRADRLAYELPGIEHIGMLAFLRRAVQQEREWFEDLYWYKKIYNRYFILLEHPNAKYRFKLISNYRRWSFLDYGLHMLQVTKWFFRGKGWNGL